MEPARKPTDEIAAILEECDAKPPTTPAPALARSGTQPTILPANTHLGWPALRGPAGDNTSPETGLDLEWPETGPREKWRIAVGSGYSSPVVVAGSLVLPHRRDDREIVECFDPETGQSRWAAAWPATYACPYPHSSGPYAAAAIDGPHVHAFGAAGMMACLRLADGSHVWRRDLHQEYQVTQEGWAASASPLVEGDRLIVNLGARQAGAGIIALDKRTGRTLWTATNDGASCSTATAATIHGRRYVFVWTAEALVALDPADGKVFWRIPFAAHNDEAAHGTAPLVAGDKVFVSGYQVGNLCLRIREDGSCEQLWRDAGRVMDSQYHALLHRDGCVIGFATSRRSLRCVDLATGTLKWKWHSPVASGSLIAVDGGCILFGESGGLVSMTLDASGVRERSVFKRGILEPRCCAYPALHNGLLFLRGENEMVCIDLRRPARTKALARSSAENAGNKEIR